MSKWQAHSDRSDVGAAVSVISEQQLQQTMFPDTQVFPAHALLRTYNGEPMPVTGEMNTQVQYQFQSCSLPLLVIMVKDLLFLVVTGCSTPNLTGKPLV